MKINVSIVLSFLYCLSYSQTENNNYKRTTENFVTSYNLADYNAIFALFSNEMKDALPLDKTTEFLSGLMTQAGKIVQYDFIKYENETYASYKTTFDNGILTLDISIDADSKINGLLVKPFIDQTVSENDIKNAPLINNAITQKQADLIFENFKLFPNNTEFAFAFIKNGNVSYYGFKRSADSILTIDNYQSVFEIGSITKVFTSTLLSGLILDKKISLNENINDYLNVTFNNNSKLTFLELANHTSGLPRLPTNLDLTKVDPANPYKEYNAKDLEDYLSKSLELPQNLIRRYQYSNLGAGLIGHVLCKKENASFDSLLQSRIFSKYEMSNSTSNQNKVKGAFVNGLDAEGNKVANWDFDALAGAGGIFSNVEDLSKFAIAQFDTTNEELSLTRQKTFEINDNLGIGLGWYSIKSKSGNSWNWHNGATGGYTSSMVIDTKSKNGVIILSNVSAFHPKMGNIDDLIFKLMTTLEEE